MGKRFTLLELITAVAILMVLAAIAIPALHENQLKARFAETYPNTNTILDAMMAYQMSAADPSVGWAVTAPSGGGVPGKQRNAWPAGTNYSLIGFEPDGDVYGQYFVSSSGTSTVAHCSVTGTSGLAATAGNALYASASTDLDGDGTDQHLRCCETATGTGFQGTVSGRCGTLYRFGTGFGKEW